jgi:adenylate cyclase
MTDATTDGMDDLIARTRAHRVTPEQMEEIATRFDAIGTARADVHAAFARTRAHAMRGNYNVDLTVVDALVQRFHDVGDPSGAARTQFFRGWAMQMTGRYAEALEEYATCLAVFEQLRDPGFIANTLTQIGTIHNATGDFPAALVDFNRALALFQQVDDRIGIAGTMSNFGTIYLSVRDLDRAYRAFSEAIPLHEANNDKKYLAATLNNLGVTHFYRNEFDRAVEIFARVLDLRLQLGEPVAILEARGILIETYVALGDDASARAMLEDFDEHGSPEPQFRIDMVLTRARLAVKDGDATAARQMYLQALAMAEDFSLPSRQLEVHRELRDLALQQNDLASYVDHNTKHQALTERFVGTSTARQLTEIEKSRELETQKQELEQHRSALHATLPKDIADRLVRGEVINDHFTDAAVLFADIVGFTTHTSAMPAGDVVAFLEHVFSTFDAICERHGVTKIKTIGDSYMCFIGEHDAPTNAVSMALAAREMLDTPFMWPQTSPDVAPERMALRIGIHIGPVTAGVIGTQRLQYDVWGDTVNVASRMESSGSPGQIHVSQAFADNLKSNIEPTGLSDELQVTSDKSHSVYHEVSHEVSHSVSHEVSDVSHEVQLVTRHRSLVTIPRGSIDIKGKGLMNTFWLEQDSSVHAGHR